MSKDIDWEKYDKLTNQPESKSSIYFKTKSDKIFPGTFRGYDEFWDIWGNNYQDSDIKEFRKREIFRETTLNLPLKIQEDSWDININTSRKNGFHWVAAANKESEEIIVKGETFEEVKKEILSKIKS